MNPTTFDSKQFRNALGTYPTGVAIVTTRGLDGRPVGLTINSFSSLSLDPPLVLWSVADTATCFGDFSRGSHFAVHVLHEGQEALSRAFAVKSSDKFVELPTETGAGDVPLLQDFHTRFQCIREHCYPGGDHSIIVGRVLQIDSRDGTPLVFCRGKYRLLVPA